MPPPVLAKDRVRYPEFDLRVASEWPARVQWTVQARRAVARKVVPIPSVTITEAARRLGVSTKTIRRRIAEGTVAAHKASGPGGFQYRVTDAAVLAIPAGQVSLPVPASRGGHAEAMGWTRLVEGLASQVADERVARARAEWERDQLAAELAALRRALPPPADDAPPARRSWWRWFGR